MSVKAVLFDLDETLLARTQSLREFVGWQANGMLKNSIDNIEHFTERFIQLDDNGKVWKDEVYSCLIDEFQIEDWSVEELVQSYLLCFCGFSKPKQGALEVVSQLKRMGYKLGLVSNGKSPFQERNFNALGFSHMFDSVIISEAVNCRKPSAEIFELACRELGVATTEVVFVGDNPVADIDGANSCGMYTVLIPSELCISCVEANATCSELVLLPTVIECAG